MQKNFNKRKDEVIQLIKNSDVPAYVRNLNNKYVKNAEKQISKIGSNDTKKKLEELARIIRI